MASDLNPVQCRFESDRRYSSLKYALVAQLEDGNRMRFYTVWVRIPPRVQYAPVAQLEDGNGLRIHTV